MAKTLEELKRENAEAEENQTSETPEEGVDTEADKTADEIVEELEEKTEESEEENNSSDDDSDSDETEDEPWMQTDEQTSDDANISVPVAKHAQLRKKLKGTIREQNDELEALRAENEALKAKIQPPGTDAPQAAPSVEVGPRPRLDDFDLDEEKYNAALDEWHDKRIEAKLQTHTQTSAQIAEAQQAAQRLKTTVNSHYERAEQLIEQSGISPDVYQQADTNVRQMVESVRPGQGELITDHMISVLGDGSEKVMYYLGRNSTALSHLQSLLVTDPQGLQAMAYLGRVASDVTAPRKKQSTAPKPAAQIRGDEANKGDPAKKWHKKYKSAGEDIQTRFNIKMEAKRAGVDVSNW